MITLTWYGTATILLDIEGEKLLFDPFFRMNKKLEKPSLQTFCNVNYIFNTHPHLDHACNLPLILKNSQAAFYAPNQTIKCLEKISVDSRGNAKIALPGDIIKTKNANITVHKSKHIKFDFALILRTIFRSLFKFQFAKAFKLLKLNNKFKMKGEIVAYEVKTEVKKIFLMGSACNMKNYNYPKDIDVLVWPFQGRSNITKYSMKIVEKIAPKMVILDHFDNAYPPITSHIKTNKFISLMQKKHPEIKVIEPRFGEEIKI